MPALVLKFFQVEGRFLRYHKEVPIPAVGFVAEQLEAPPAVWFDYPFKGRSGSRDREQLHAFLGFRQATVEDMEPILLWLSQEDVPVGSGTNLCQFLVAGHGVSMRFSNRRR